MDMLKLPNTFEPAYIAYPGYAEPTRIAALPECLEPAIVASPVAASHGEEALLQMQYLASYSSAKDIPSNGVEIEDMVDLIAPPPGLALPPQVQASDMAHADEIVHSMSGWIHEMNMWPTASWYDYPSWKMPSVSHVAQPIHPQDRQIARRTKRPREQKGRRLLLIATQLNALQEEDPDKIIIVRKIHRLGFESAKILTEHYSQIGPVVKVLLSNAHEKQAAPFSVRLRPSGIGFVLFENAADAAAALALGECQNVAGAEVHVREFKRKAESIDEAQCASDCEDVGEMKRVSSTASTTDSGSVNVASPSESDVDAENSS